MRISKRTREQAALICQMAASNHPHLFYVAESALGIGWTNHQAPIAGRLARDAFYEAQGRRPSFGPAPTCALAESLLRTGWCPDE